MTFSSKDKDIIRKLVEEKHKIALLPQNNENIKFWTAINDLKMIKPMIHISQMPFHEVDKQNFMKLQCEDPFLREVEGKLKFELFEYRVAPCNRVVKDYYEHNFVSSNSGFGITEDVDIVKTDEDNDVVSRHFNIQISSMKDIDKIKFPRITIDLDETQRRLEAITELIGDIMPVKLVGNKGHWFAVWDNLIRLTGIEEAMLSLYDDPDYIEALVDRYVDVNMSMLEQFNQLGLWGSNNDNMLVGSGGYGYTSDLPKFDDNAHHCDTRNMWGCANAQIFSEISPQMHWDFSLKHDMKWLERFGLNYYGCCEPLHFKMGILEKIPNLRKISCSPWCDLEKMAPQCQGKYVMSIKPNPAIFIGDFSFNKAKQQVKDIIKKVKGCDFELILKDISTIDGHDNAIRIWNDAALEAVNEEY